MVIENEVQSDKKTCFVITPIGEENSAIRRHVDGVIDAAIIPALKEVENIEFDIIVPHRMYNATTITKEIYQSLYECDLIIANLTGLNPNVMYELAIRFCIGKPIILIAEEGTKLPFDVKDQRTFFYINDSKGTIELKNRIINVLENIDFNDKPSSPIYDALGEVILFQNLESEGNDENGVSQRAISAIYEKIDGLESYIKSIPRRISSSNINGANSIIKDRINLLYRKIYEQDEWPIEELDNILSDIDTVKMILSSKMGKISEGDYHIYISAINNMEERIKSYNNSLQK